MEGGEADDDACRLNRLLPNSLRLDECPEGGAAPIKSAESPTIFREEDELATLDGTYNKLRQHANACFNEKKKAL